MNPSYYILGAVTVAADYENVTAFLNLCMHLSIPYSDFKSYPDKVTVKFRSSEYKQFEKDRRNRPLSQDTFLRYISRVKRYFQ